jgi:molybdopterin molybdotransferase
VPIRDALGRVLAADASSADDVPGFDSSAMDGFAVGSADTRGARDEAPVTLAVVGESRAGHPSPLGVEPGQAIRISTGAVLPAGADAVVRVEDTLPGSGSVNVRVEVPPGKEVRRAGEDVRRGETVLQRGTVIGPAEVGVLASIGVQEALCARRPCVGIVITGDELVEPGEPLAAGQIRNSNAYSVTAQAVEAGAKISDVQLVPDDLGATVEAISGALENDVIVCCGGVSVGDHDHVKAALAEVGVEEVFWGLALRPGHPTWFGVHASPPGAGSSARPTLVFGLPGNPVSAMVTFHLFARPALAALSGASPESRTTTGVMDEDYRKQPGRAHAVRCRATVAEDGWHVRPTKDQSSHVLTSMLGANALALLEVERGSVTAGERVRIELL